MNIEEKFVITINRELGSGGRTVGRILAERLGVNYYDKAIIQGLKERFGLTMEEIERLKAERHESWLDELRAAYRWIKNPAEEDAKPGTDEMFLAERQIYEGLAEKESCVVAGRTGFIIFREWPNHLNVFLQASIDYRITRVAARKQISREEAAMIINQVDEGREAYVMKHCGRSRYDTRNYDLVITTDGKTEAEVADFILRFVQNN